MTDSFKSARAVLKQQIKELSHKSSLFLNELRATCTHDRVGRSREDISDFPNFYEFREYRMCLDCGLIDYGPTFTIGESGMIGFTDAQLKNLRYT